jgi:hypothetical protein
MMHNKFVKPKTVPMSLGLVLDNTDCPELPDPIKQKHLALSILRGKCPIHSILGTLRYLVCGGAARTFLCFRKTFALCSAGASDGIPHTSAQSQA